MTYVSHKNATGKFNAATKELTVKIDRLEAGASKNISIGLSLQLIDQLKRILRTFDLCYRWYKYE